MALRNATLTKRNMPHKEILLIVDKFIDNVAHGLHERQNKLPIDLYHSETYEAIGGLLSRQATLAINIAQSPSIWNPHICPILLRVMIDVHITLSWILTSPHALAKKYILYGLGQEKLLIEHYNTILDKLDGDDLDRTTKLVNCLKSWLNSQRHDFLTEVNVGNWTGTNTRKIALEAGLEELYNFAYTPFSSAIHSTWQHVSKFNLQTCCNPLHKMHKVPVIFEFDPDIDCLVKSAKYVALTFCSIDRHFQLDISTKDPLDHLIDLLNQHLPSTDENQ